jgi:hypothetical protein
MYIFVDVLADVNKVLLLLLYYIRMVCCYEMDSTGCEKGIMTGC